MKNIPSISVDFNEMIDIDIVYLSQSNTRKDSYKLDIQLSEGLEVIVYENDINHHGNIDRLISKGYVIRNPIK